MESVAFEPSRHSLASSYLSEFDMIHDNESQILLDTSSEDIPKIVTVYSSPENTALEPQVSPPCELVDCPNKDSGCTEKIVAGTESAKDHCEKCLYRPIKCWLHHVCDQSIPYSGYLLHLYNHFIYPVFSNELTTSVILDQLDFDSNQRWHPRWLSCFGKDFFVMISHNLPGIWYFWVRILGTPEEARQYSYDVEVSKASVRKAGTFSVLSCRMSEEDLDKHEFCLSMTDYQVKKMSQIGKNLIASLELDLVIHKKPLASQHSFLLWEKGALQQ